MKIQIKNIHKRYSIDKGNEVAAIKGVDLTIESGESVAVVGPSGAGKSTLLHVLGLMDAPTEGEVVFDDTNCALFNDKKRAFVRREEIGFIFQMHYLLPEFTVYENIKIPLIIRTAVFIPTSSPG